MKRPEAHIDVVYVIGPDEGSVKIGKGYSAAVRLKVLQTGHPARLRIHHEWPHKNTHALEREAHRLLAAHKLYGEWFNVTAAEAAAAVETAIRNLKTRNQVDNTPTRRSRREPDMGEPPPAKEGLFADLPAPVVTEAPGQKVAYVRALQDVPISVQDEWVKRCGVNREQIFTDRNAWGEQGWRNAWRYVREGDALFIYTPRVLGNEDMAFDITERMKERGIALVAPQMQEQSE